MSEDEKDKVAAVEGTQVTGRGSQEMSKVKGTLFEKTLQMSTFSVEEMRKGLGL